MKAFMGLFFMAMLINTGLAHAEDPCLDCHEKKTPGIVDYWKKSAHYEKGVGCASCHGTNIDANHKREVTVEATKCGSCHTKAFTEHRLSKHAISLKSGKGCTRNIEHPEDKGRSCTFCHEAGSTKPLTETECAMFLAQSKEMQKRGCESCHRIEASCDTCHTKHGTDLTLAKNPGMCGVCHMGPDHPQLEMWETSAHGVIYKAGGRSAAPDCVTCHMQKGSHNVSRGIAAGIPEEVSGMRKNEREFMVSICAGCHTREFAAKNLADGDTIEKQGSVLVQEAKTIVEGLQNDGLLFPPVAERPPHPIWKNTFVIGAHMLYENLSSVESLFFKMKQFYYLISYKGVFHQNPDYAHWYGNAPLKLTLSEIKSEAALLRQVDVLKKRLDNLNLTDEKEKDDLIKKLKELNEKRLKGDITDKEYERAKNIMLDEKGL
jgi:hydroxylamine dehydrogenase